METEAIKKLIIELMGEVADVELLDLVYKILLASL